jgi:hypothetical protein
VSTLRADRSGKAVVFEISTIGGGSHRVQIPKDVPFEEIDKVVRAQTPSPGKMAIQLPAEEKALPDAPKQEGENLGKPADE